MDMQQMEMQHLYQFSKKTEQVVILHIYLYILIRCEKLILVFQKEIMKRRILILNVLFILFSVINLYAENIKICFIQENGTKIEKEYSATIETLVLFDVEKMKTVSIENQNVYKSVKVLELQKMAFIENLDFINMFPNLKKLYIGYGVKCSSVNLKNLKNLEFVEIAGKKIILKQKRNVKWRSVICQRIGEQCKKNKSIEFLEVYQNSFVEEKGRTY